MEKIISVIIPAYNAEKTIAKAIESVIGENIEIIVVIDGATDNTLKVCQDIKNDNIRIVEQTNKGLFEARNTGIRNAKGKYIMFLDSDDYYKNNVINRLKEIINKYNEPDLIRFRYSREPNMYEQYKYFEEDEKEIKQKDFVKHVYPMFLNGYMLNSLCANCIKKDVLDKLGFVNETIQYGEDLIRNLEIFSNIENVVFINDILYGYVYQENSMTTTKSINKLLGNLEDAIEVYSRFYLYLKRWGMDTLENVEIVNKRIQNECCAIIKIIEKSQN